MALPAPERPPEGVPPVLLTVDPSTEPPGHRSPAAAVEGGRLMLAASAPGSLAGYPFSSASFRDVIVEAVVGLETGGPRDAYGLFFRQVDSRAFLAFVVTIDRRSSVLAVEDGTPRVIAEGPIPADAPFAAGPGAANRLTVVAMGPCLTCVINGFVLSGVIVEPRYKAGLAGTILLHADTGEARAGLRWAQVRAILPDQA